MSTDIIPPNIAPNNIALAPCIEAKPLFNQTFMKVAIGLTTTHIIVPVINTDNTGYNKIIFKPFNDFGNPDNTFTKILTTTPAKNPPINAPINPGVGGIFLLSTPINKYGNSVASNPATNPEVNAARSLILKAIYPPNIGKNKPNALFPIVINNFANGAVVPNPPPTFAFPANVSTKNANAIKIPPLITNGNI